jgi:hypothetical protein
MSSGAAPASPCCIVEIRSVRIPSQVDRPELVVRRSDEQVIILSNDLWVAPLDEEVRSALLNDIQRRLPQVRPGGGSSAHKFVVFVDVSRFESESGKYALIEAEWRVEPSAAPKAGAPVCKTLVRVDISGGVSGVVQGYQEAIAKVASGITLNVVSAEADGALECPI